MKQKSIDHKIRKSRRAAGYLLLLMFFLLNWQQSYAQLVINEVNPANFSGFRDEDGDFEDWIELYNAGSDTVNLENYSITDNPDLPEKWVFPETEIAPHAYLVIFASDKNRKNVIREFETVIHTTDSFRYNNATSEPPAEWCHTGFQDTA